MKVVEVTGVLVVVMISSSTEAVCGKKLLCVESMTKDLSCILITVDMAK